MKNSPSQQSALLGWLMCGAILSLGVIAMVMWSEFPTTAQPTSANKKVVIHSVAGTAFGSLAGNTTLATKWTPTRDSISARTESLIAPVPPEFKEYQYVYTGMLPVVDLPVLRRAGTLEGGSSTNWNSLTSLVDLNGVGATQLQQVTLKDPSAKGFTVMLDYQNGSISIYRVPALETKTTSVSAEASSPDRVSIENIPSEEQVVAASNAFLDQHQIRRTGLGAPVMQTDWQIALRAAPEADRMAYIPTDMSVIYPWKLQGKNVYDEGGNLYGLYVSVSAADLNVTNVSNIVPMEFEASKYELENDPKKLVPIIQRGGWYGGGVSGTEGAELVSLTVGEPEVAYILSRYQLDQVNPEYLVPALFFPIQNPPSDQPYFMKHVIVPLAKDLLSTEQQPKDDIQVLPAETTDLP